MFAPTRLDRTILRLSGPDAHGFLNNLVTQELGLLAAQPVIYAGLLTPQGKVLADFFVWAEGDALLLDAPAARGGDLLRRLTMYRLRAQVEIADVSGALSAFAAPAFEPGPLSAADPRLPALGWRKLAADGPGADSAGLAAHRIALGVPDLAEDAAADEVFALEALFEELHGVAFDKGCFVGQENVSRMKRRATTRKKFCRLSVSGPVPKGAPVLAGDVEVGQVRAAADGAALALVRLDRAMEARDSLRAGTANVRLDPPAWLILPAADKV